jgi:hypothetical protein
VEALQRMKGLLSPKGVLMYNRLARYEPDIERSRKFLNDVFMKVFPDGGYLDVDGNWMLVSRMDYFK